MMFLCRASTTSKSKQIVRIFQLNKTAGATTKVARMNRKFSRISAISLNYFEIFDFEFARRPSLFPASPKPSQHGSCPLPEIFEKNQNCTLIFWFQFLNFIILFAPKHSFGGRQTKKMFSKLSSVLQKSDSFWTDDSKKMATDGSKNEKNVFRPAGSATENDGRMPRIPKKLFWNTANCRIFGFQTFNSFTIWKHFFKSSRLTLENASETGRWGMAARMVTSPGVC